MILSTQYLQQKFVRKWALNESSKRSIAKAVSWRITGTLDTFIISWLITGELTLAGAIAFTEIVTKVFLYWFHERIWNRVHWGRTTD
jgi:uncharacterized membrane protein